MFDRQFHFDGSFKPECQQHSIPNYLLYLVNMILNGPNIEHQSKIDIVSISAALSISHLVMFNRVENLHRLTPPNSTYHRHEKETSPLH